MARMMTIDMYAAVKHEDSNENIQITPLVEVYTSTVNLFM